MLLTFLVVEPLFHVGFTTTDDLKYYLYYTQNSVSTNKILSYLKSTGFRPLHFPFISVPYIFDSFIWFKVTQIFALLLSLVSLSFLVTLITKNKYVGFFTYLLLIGLIQNSWGHNILTSYPFIFHMCLSLIFISLILFYYWLETKKLILFIISLVLYIMPLLVTEVHIFYSILFPLIVFLYIKQNKMQLQLYKKEYIYSFMYILCAILFVIIYFWFKSMYGENYSGTKLNLSNIQNIISVLTQYSLSAFPSYVYFKLELIMTRMSQGRDFFYPSEMGLFNILNLLSAKWYFIAFINTILSYYLINKFTDNLKLYISLFIVSLIFIFLPNLPLSLTLKYQGWVQNGDINYIYTFYSYLSIILIFISTFGIISSILKNKYQKMIFSLIASLFIFTLSIFNGYGNQQIYKMQMLSHNKWIEVDKFLNTSYFKKIPDNSIIIAPSLINNYSIVSSNKLYWKKYIKYKSGKNIILIKDLVKDISIIQKNKNKPIYYLRFNQDNNSMTQYIIFSRINGITVNKYKHLQIFSNNANILTSSNFGKISLVGERLESKQNNIIINNKLLKDQPLYFSQNTIFMDDNKNNIKVIQIQAKSIVLNKLNINTFVFSDL